MSRAGARRSGIARPCSAVSISARNGAAPPRPPTRSGGSSSTRPPAPSWGAKEGEEETLHRKGREGYAKDAKAILLARSAEDPRRKVNDWALRARGDFANKCPLRVLC